MKKKASSNKKHSFKDILRGKFLVDETAFSNWKLIAYIIFLLFLMVSSAHSVDKKAMKIKNLTEEVDEMKAKYAYVSSQLMNLQLESELTKQVLQDSLFALQEHPIKIIIPKK